MTGSPQEVTVPAQSISNYDSSSSTTISLSETVERWENLPIPAPDFCADRIEKWSERKVYDRKELSSSGSDRPRVMRNIAARLSGLEIGRADLEADVKPPRLDIGRDDLPHLKDLIKTSVDIDSAMAIDFPLNMIKVPINLTFILNRGRMIESDMHMEVSRSRGLHQTRHFNIGNFGSSEVRFELYVFIIGENKEAVSTTHVPDSIIKPWMNEIMLKAAMMTIPHFLRSQWPSNYENELAKSEAIQEVRKLRVFKVDVSEHHVKRKPRYQTLPPEYIQPFWEECMRLLKAAIDAGHPELKHFKDFKLFYHAKNIKDVVYDNSGNLESLHHLMREKVKPLNFNSNK